MISNSSISCCLLSNLCLGLVLMTLTLMIDQISSQETKVLTKRSFGNTAGIPLNFTQLAVKNFLETEEHVVKTEDGYLIRLFRVKMRGCQVRGLPVVLNHGLLLDASCWITAEQLSPAYLIASTCVDLWLPNARGTRYSRSHTTLTPNEKAFWNFSVDEIGRYDVPAIIDYVLTFTGYTKLNYIGFSQGAGTFFIMCSELPHYCHKIRVMIGLAPATRHLNAKSELTGKILNVFKKFESVLDAAGVYEAFAHNGPSSEIFKLFCPISDITLRLCEVFTNLLGGASSLHLGSLSKNTLERIIDTFPSGTSVHNLARYGQSLHLREFQKFDYGILKNIKLYGSASPPIYNFGAVVVPTVIIYGTNDGITDVADVEWTINQLPQVIEAVKVQDPLWNHFDMTYGKNFKEYVFPKIMEYLHF